MGNIDYEKATVSKMIAIYCRNKHKTKNGLCSECSSLNDYASLRLSKCKFGDNKPDCKKCPVHCYASVQREQIRKIMRYSGPRMLIYYPFDFIIHYKAKKNPL